jgi:hypothetical protein
VKPRRRQHRGSLVPGWATTVGSAACRAVS